MSEINEKNRLGLAGITTGYRVTLPEKVRKFLDVKEDGSDYLLFYSRNDGCIIIRKLAEESEHDRRGK